MGKKLFVGGLSWDTTKESLQSYFEGFGTVVECTLKTDLNTGRSRGFGFVEFSEETSAQQVLDQASHSLDGRYIDPKPASGPEPILKVFVGGLDPEVAEETIREHFEQYGRVEEINLPFDKEKNQRRAFCFVKFETEEIVDQVVAQSRQVIGSQEVDVKKLQPKNNQGGFRGGRGGAGGARGAMGGAGGTGFRGRGGRGGRGGGGGGYYGGTDYGNGGYGNGYGQYDEYSSGYGSGYGAAAYGNGGYGSKGSWGTQGSYNRSYHPY